MAKITKTKDGLYTTKAYIGRRDGKVIQKRLVAPSKALLQQKVTLAKISFNKEEETKTILTLRKAYDSYIRSRENLLSPYTINQYRKYMQNSFQKLMDLPIDEITDEQIQAEINSMARNLSFKTIRNRYGLFMSVMRKYALNSNFDIKLPMKEKSVLYIPTKEEVDMLIESVKGTNYEVPIMLAALCGMRRGEIFALTWDDINLKKRTITIDKSLGKVEGGYEIKSPKSFAGYRDVTIPDRLYNALNLRFKAKEPLIGVSIHRINKVFPKLLKKANLPHFRFHDLRHYFASVLVTLDIPDLYAIKLLGHSTTNFLRKNYQHIMSEPDRIYQQKLRENL